MATKQKTAIIVGAGVGGIASAARLAKAGFSVTVVEKNGFTGGRCSLIHHDGYRFDQGPSLLLLPNMFHQAFADLGTTLAAEGVELYKCDPNYNIWFSDGERVQMSTDLALMKREIEKFEGKGGFERYLHFLAEAHQHYELSVKHVLLKAWDSYASLLRPVFLQRVLNLHPLESMYSRASHYFRTDRLRRLFTFESMYMGMSPFDAPGTYSLLQYTELVEGIWYPKGGFHAVLDALVRVGERFGVDYRLNTSVKQVLISPTSKRATGVELESGEVLTADVVLINADLTYAYNNLLPASSYARRLSTRATSCSSISFYWALDTKIPQLSAHNIFLADDYRGSFDSIFKDHVLPEEPSFYVNVPSRVDPTAAPEGKDALVVLVPCGHLLGPPADTLAAKAENVMNGNGPATRKGIPDPTSPPHALTNGSAAKANKVAGQDFDKLVNDARDAVIRIVNQRISGSPLSSGAAGAFPKGMTTKWSSTAGVRGPAITSTDATSTSNGSANGSAHGHSNGSAKGAATNTAEAAAAPFDLRRHIAHELVNDPVSWRALFNLDRGAILGLSHDFLNVLAFRPRTRCGLPGCANVYFVGASTQPGTGVPIVLGGSKVVCDRICADLAVRVHGGGAQVQGAEVVNDHGRMVGAEGMTVGGLDVDRGLVQMSWIHLVGLLVLVLSVVLAYDFGAFS